MSCDMSSDMSRDNSGCMSCDMYMICHVICHMWYVIYVLCHIWYVTWYVIFHMICDISHDMLRDMSRHVSRTPSMWHLYCRRCGILYHPLKWLNQVTEVTFNWSERSACAAHAVLQTGCMANVVATEFIGFFLSLHLPEGVVLGSWKFVWALISVKLNEKAVPRSGPTMLNCVKF
jgi:hypothetical protein